MNRSSTALSHGAFGVGIAASVALAACGGAAGGEAKPAKSAEPESTAREPEPKTVLEAMAQIEQAHADLSTSEEAAKKATEVDKDSAHPKAPGAGGSTSSTTARPTTPGVREESTRNAPADTCSQSCRALSSMRRAVSALCRMTGDEDTRCSDAKKTLERSESRVARCHCSP